MGRFGEKTREARLRWYRHVRRKDDGYIGRRMLRLELPGNGKRVWPKRRLMDVVKEDMAEVEMTEEDTEYRTNWRWKICCVDPLVLRWEKPNEELITKWRYFLSAVIITTWRSVSMITRWHNYVDAVMITRWHY